jgi:hypothetical protein
MSNTMTQPGVSRIRQLLTATRKAPRKLRIAGAAGLIALAGTVALVAAPAAANAATASTTTPNPTCAIPAGATYQLVGEVNIGQLTGNPFLLGDTLYFWTAPSNGVYYNGLVTGFTLPPNQVVAEGHSAATDCYIGSTPL